MTISSKDIEKIQQYFRQQPVLAAYLFGSYARDEAKAESDIDILVELDYNENIGWEFIQMQIDLQQLLARRIDLVSSRGLSKYVSPIIDKEKKQIYAR